MPGLDAQVAALTDAFCELVKMLGKEDHIAVTQLARALEDKATTPKAGAETKAALSELARKFRNPS